ncbi:MAG: hypothetical protein ACD_11C00004G0029 [uncultured bacterium]|nr:MAG: hypothetical protein ACD_11C00004G0029 [uncultured bacterium]HBR71662.1 hypothetical protein [Candidatus Moranbacteria bacterium]
MFGFFSGKKDNFIGVDFGTSSIKIIELTLKNGKPYLENYGSFDLAGITESINGSNEPILHSYEDRMRAALKNLIGKMKMKGNIAFAAIPGFNGLVVLIEFPAMKEEEIEKAVEFEAHKYIPASIDEISLSWEIVKKNKGDIDKKSENDGGNIEVLLVAAPKREVSRYGNFFVDSGLTMEAIELETFSIARALIGNRPGNFIIVDIGSRSTNLILVENGSIVVNRSITAGGEDITKSIAESLNISKQRAESFKQENKDFINNKESAITIPILELINGEVKRMLNVYNEKNKDKGVESIILSGGTSAMFGLDKYFSENLKVKIEKGDPWKNLEYDKKLETSVRKMGASFSVAIGLAMRGFEESN